MSAIVSTLQKTFTAAAAISAYTRVYLSAADTVSAAGATGASSFAIGYTLEDAAAADRVPVKLLAPPVLVRAAVAITAASELYPAASGQVSGISTGLKQIGVANESATAANDIIEMIVVESGNYHS
jgi:hypothetical protein